MVNGKSLVLANLMFEDNVYEVPTTMEDLSVLAIFNDWC